MGRMNEEDAVFEQLILSGNKRYFHIIENLQ